MKKVTINEANYEAFALDYLEGEMDMNSKLAFETFLIEHPHIDAELKAMNMVYLQPEQEIIFENKHLLTQNVHRLHWRRYLSIAAAILLLLISGSLVFNIQNSSEEITEVSNDQTESSSTENHMVTVEHEAHNDVIVAELNVIISEENKAKEPPTTQEYKKPEDQIVQSVATQDIVEPEVDLPLSETEVEETAANEIIAAELSKSNIDITSEANELHEKRMGLAEVQQLSNDIDDIRLGSGMPVLNSQSIDAIKPKTKINLKGLVPTAFEKQELAVNTKRPKLFRALIPETLSR